MVPVKEDVEVADESDWEEVSVGLEVEVELVIDSAPDVGELDDECDDKEGLELDTVTDSVEELI